MYNYKPVVLVVMDGWGEWETKMGNPVSCAKLPTIRELDQYYPKLLIEASSLAVGLPWGVFGNSEVGHQTMGSGQIIYHYLPTITAAIQSRSFFRNPVLSKAMALARERGTKLHLWGLCSGGGVHSHIDHLFALLSMAKEQGLAKVFVHAVTDGRDTPTKDGAKYIDAIQKHIERAGVGRIATLCGRYWAMDRNRNWDRLEKAFMAYVQGEGRRDSDPFMAISRQYGETITDEYLEPVVICDSQGAPAGLLEKGDVVINFNYRADRARQFSHALLERPFSQFKAVRVPEGIHYTGFTEYEEGMDMPVAFPPQKITTRLGDILSRNGKRQLRIAETEKYAHVTYFFNGGLADPFPGEERVIVPSKKVRSYAEVPDMSAPEVNEKLLKAVEFGGHDFILVNYANPDMVGHTGDFKAAIKALETTDRCLGELVRAVLARGGCLLVTADHGNIEEMINLETGEIDTQHSTNPVPVWFVANDSRYPEAAEAKPPEIKGMLADITVTILNLFNIRKPSAMIGESLFDRFDWKKVKK